MDAKCLKNRKHSKRSKNVTGEKNTNVLVVPPDILKKLGINIGSAPAPQGANNVNAVQSPELANNSSQAGIPTSTYANKEKESSIQETANLMKKSVFLSPTFIDTVTNVIPGEVEFFNDKTLNNIEIAKRLPEESRHVINDVNKPNSKQAAINGEVMTNVLSTAPILYEHIKRDSSNAEKFNIIKGQHVNGLLSPKMQDHIGLLDNKQIIGKDTLHDQTINRKEDNAITTEGIVLLNNLVSTQGHAQSTYHTHDKLLAFEEDATNNFIPIEVLGEISATSVDENTTVIQGSEPVDDIIALKDTIKVITNSEIENNIISLPSHVQTFPVKIEPAQGTNYIISLKENIDFINETETLNNIISTNSAHIQLAKVKSNLSYEKDSINVIVDANIDSNLVHSEVSTLQIDQVEVENNLVSSKELPNVITLPQIENDLISLEEHVQPKQVQNNYNSICAKANVKLVHSHQTQNVGINYLEKKLGSDNKFCELEEIKTEINHDRSKPNDFCFKEINFHPEHTDTPNIIDTVIDDVIEDSIESNNISAVNLPFVKKICEKPSLEEENEIGLNKITDSNIVVNGMLPILSTGARNMKSVMEQDKQDSNGMQYPQISQQQSVDTKSLVSGEISCVETKSNIDNRINKIDQKICIISQEIITSSNSEEHRRSLSSGTNTKINHGISVDITVTSNQNSVSSSNLDVFSSDTSVANTKNSVGLVPPTSKQKNSAIHDSVFSVPVRTNETFANALPATNNRNHIMNKNINTLCGASEDKDVTTDQKADKIGLNQNNNTKNFIEKDIGSKNDFAKEKNTTKKINSSEDELCEDELNNILKSTKENNNAILQADKVREIANYIKKFSHLYKDKKMDKMRDIIKTKNDKRESINAKTNTTKSKLCIQGVEKPGGNKYQKKTSGETKILKTYTRQKRKEDIQKSRINSVNIKDILCNIEDKSITDELSNVDVAMSSKTQVFCLCHDFGHLYECDNSYEHIHFWLHNTSTDLETIFSIYNDDDTIYTDRILLDNDKLLKISTDDTTVGNICWNYFSYDQTEAHHKNSNKTLEMKDSGIAKIKQVVSGYQQKECENVNTDSNTPDMICVQVIDNPSLKVLSVDELQKESSTTNTITAENSNLEIDTNIHNDKNTDNKERQCSKRSDLLTKVPTKDALEREDKKEEGLNESNYVKDGSSNGKSKVNSDMHTKRDSEYKLSNKQTLANKDEEPKASNKIRDSPKEKIDTQMKKAPDVESSGNRTLKRSYSGTGEGSGTEICEEPSSKRNIKCGPCGKLLLESKWEDHVAKKHCHVAWQAGTTFNFDDPALLKKLEHTLNIVGKLKCPSCYTQMKKMNKFINHIKHCLVLQDAMGHVANKEQILKNSRHSFSGEKSSIDSESGPSIKRSLNRSYPGRDFLETAGAVRSEEPPSKKNIKCGVCDKLFPEEKWEHHVAKKHCHIAWRAGTTFNVDDPDLLKKLEHTLQVSGKLKCPNCNTQTKKINKFMNHIKLCLRLQNTSSRRASLYKKDTVKCGVCKQNVQYISWVEHIGIEHNYLAWIEGMDELNLEDEAAVIEHLKTVIRNSGSLVCYKCGLSRKRAQLYLDHIKTCDGTESHCHSTIVSSDLDLTNDQEDPSASDTKIMTCGVCKQEVQVIKWVEHIAKEHNYLAWEEGATPLNMNDEEAVWNHLQDIIRQNEDGLVCYKCGLSRKRVKLYLAHIKTCDGEDDRDVSMRQDTSDKKEIECGVCNATVSIAEWHKHIGMKHNYLAWRADGPPLDLNDEEAVKEHLLEIIRNYEGLTCYKCGLNRRRAKLYLEHVRNCGNQSCTNESTDSVNVKAEGVEAMEITTQEANEIVTCAVCEEEVSSDKWIDHIGKKHEYLAWQRGKTPLDLTDEDAVKAHLMNVSRENDGLICNKCQTNKKYPKTFQQHIVDCDGILSPSDTKIKIYEPGIYHFDVSDVTTETVTCGVCKKEVTTSKWMDHIQKEHNYIAWFVGKPPIDVNDSLMVQKHLIEVCRKYGPLKCAKCGVIRRYAKKYLDHISSCYSKLTYTEPQEIVNNKETVVCGVCAKTVDSPSWRDHAMNNHYNVAWIAGEPPIDINLPYVVEPYIKAYRQKNNNKLVCKTCRASRVSAVGFYAHIITCGKTEEETDVYKGLCEICNNKYLLIYKSQHMTMHKEKENALERKLLVAKEKEIKQEQFEPVEIVGGRRRAAEKAITVIEKYTSTTTDGTHCSSCGFHSEIESEMSNHVCVDIKYEESDSDVSIDLDHDSSDEDDDTDINSDISEEEREAQEQELARSRKHGDSAPKIQRLPYEIGNINSYMRRSAQQFAELHLTNEDLFTEWRNLEYEIVSDANIMNYMPPLEESCKVTYADGNWLVYNRFEASKSKEIITLFTGACIQSICWVPPRIGENLGANHQYLSVLTHLDSDVPRYIWHDTPTSKPTLIQIWDCGNLMSRVPEFAMGIALDCGTIWSIDWCPSGSRDKLDIEIEKPNQPLRLGLLAAACANGCAYIFAVPYPSTIQDSGHIFCKLKPVVELRMAMRSDRKIYQATAIKWSAQKGHAHIIVGYGDGTTGYYDLKNESPLLRSTENDVTIIYPYYDERAQGMCVEDVDVFPTQEVRHGPGPVAAGSVGGAGARCGPAGAASLHAHCAAARVLFPPHWPAPLLAGDDNLASQAVNEVEWYGGGRRVGGMRSVCGCAWCGRVALSAAPLVRLVRVHPAYTDLHRQIIAMVHMIPFGNKRKRKNDELSMIVEPLTYSGAIAKYGIEFKHITGKDKATQQQMAGTPRDTFPERFPLADITSMMFCPSSVHHQKLALAVHAGLIFIINV